MVSGGRLDLSAAFSHARFRRGPAGQFFPGNLVVPFFNENAYGYKNADGLDTVVTSGIGYYGPPMRVGTNSEITVVHVRFGE